MSKQFYFQKFSLAYVHFQFKKTATFKKIHFIMQNSSISNNST